MCGLINQQTIFIKSKATKQRKIKQLTHKHSHLHIDLAIVIRCGEYLRRNVLIITQFAAAAAAVIIVLLLLQLQAVVVDVVIIVMRRATLCRQLLGQQIRIVVGAVRRASAQRRIELLRCVRDGVVLVAAVAAAAAACQRVTRLDGNANRIANGDVVRTAVAQR